MDRKPSRKPVKPDRTERAGKESLPGDTRSGEGAASALASLKRLERDRAKNRPDDGSRE